SNHASHAEYAIQCLDAGKHVHIEKPHVVTEDQLDRLCAAMRRNPSAKVFLGVNRPRSRLFRVLKDVLSKESGPSMINWFVAGHEIPPDHWYFSEAEGGRVLGNLCHWTDLTLQLVGAEDAFPCEIGVGGDRSSPSDFVLTFAFADQSSAAITFSAKGHTFEGVREVLNCHRGNALCALEDFQQVRADVGARRLRLRLRHRDHGHGANVRHSFEGMRENVPSTPESYVRLTGALFLAARVVVDSGSPVRVTESGNIESLALR
ncbi:MAG: Gfo/Idh/MocA family protein, partial [Gemmatimonadaceae bacterium]